MPARHRPRQPAAPTAPLAVAFREVRHDQPDDCLHHETIAVRGALHHWTIPPHRHEGLHQLQWLAQGAVVARIDGAVQRLQAPVALLLAAGAVHGFDYAPDSVGQQVTVPSALLQAGLAGAPALAARLSQSLVLGPERIGDQAPQVEALLAGLADEFHGARPGRAEALRAQVLLLTLWLLRQAAPPAAHEQRQALRDTLVQRYRALLELHCRRHQPLGFYAQALGVSSDHLSRSCRRVTGLSALALAQERLLLEARRLLAHGPMPVAGVGQALGFDDAGYFSRFFTRRCGLSPSAFRAAAAQGLGPGAGPTKAGQAADML